MPILPAQETMISDALKAAKICAARAQQCSANNLMTLAREWDYFSKSLVICVERQKAALESLEPEAAVDGN